MSRVTRSTQTVSDENAAPKDHFKFTKRGSGIGGGLAPKPPPPPAANPVKPTLNTRKTNTARPALGNITNRTDSRLTSKDQLQQMKKIRVAEEPEKAEAEKFDEDLLDDPEVSQESEVLPPPPPPLAPQPPPQEEDVKLNLKNLSDDVEMRPEEERSLEDSVAELKLAEVDSADATNPQSCHEYIEHIMMYMFDTETKRLPSANYMSKQTDINSKMREILVDWLVEVHLKFKLRPETLYLTVNIIDRFLERRAVSRTKLQLVGCTAMLIASKYEEIYAPEVRDFVYISDQAYTRDQILAMESIILNTLGFYLTVPTTLRFGERLCRVAKAGPEAENLVRYLMELTLQDSKFLKFKPSEIAAAATYLALKTTGTPWDATVERHAGYDRTKMAEVLSELHQLATRDPPKYRAVRRKYLHKKFLEVSKITICEA